MTVFYKIENNKLITAYNGYNGVTGLADNPELCIANGFVEGTEEEIAGYFGGTHQIIDGVLIDISQTPEYMAEQAEIEATRIANLKLTPRDFIIGLEGLGVDFETVIEPFLASNAQARKELNYCQFVYRGNPLLNALCGLLEVSPEQLDNLFIQGNGNVG